MNKQIRLRLLEFISDNYDVYKEFIFDLTLGRYEDFEYLTKRGMFHIEMHMVLLQDPDKAWEYAFPEERERWNEYRPTLAKRSYRDQPKVFDKEAPAFIIELEKKLNPDDSTDYDYTRIKELRDGYRKLFNRSTEQSRKESMAHNLELLKKHREMLKKYVEFKNGQG